MRISVRRTGGFAGLTEVVGSVDTATLPQATARRIEQAAALAVPVADTAIGADMYRYEITISDGSSERTLSFIDDGGTAVAALRELVALVIARR